MEGGVLIVYIFVERELVFFSWLYLLFCVMWSFFGEEGDVVVLDVMWMEE